MIRSPRTLLVLASGLLLAMVVACSSSPSGDGGSPSVERTGTYGGKKLLTLKQAAGSRGAVKFSGDLPRYRWADDGRRVEHRSDDAVVLIDPDTWEEKPGEADDTDTRVEALKKALEDVEGLTKAQARSTSNRMRRSLGDEEKPLLLTVDGDLFLYDPAAKSVARLTETEAAEREGELSPDGKTVAFERDHDFWFLDLETGAETAVTSDGNEELFNGRLDWVYQEEIYGRGNFKGFWWSPESSGAAFLRLDESPVGEFTVVDHIPWRLDLEVTNYPKAGDPNPIVSLHIASRDGGEPVRVDLSEYDDDILIVRVGWTPSGDHVVFQVQDRIQRWLDVNLADPTTGAVTRLLREVDKKKAWVNVIEDPRWLDDGSFLWLSERTGYRHVYHHAADGTLIRAVTQGPWEVRSLLRVDEEPGTIWVSGSKDGAVNSNVYRVGIDGTGFTRITQGDGNHSVSFNEDASLFLDTFSNLTTPPERRLCDADGRVLKILARTEIPALDEYCFGYRELVEVPARDGFMMDATILKPPHFDPSASYPVWFDTYAGPNAPRVRNRWNSDGWHQFLAQQGYIVFQVNNRTSSRKGHTWITECYRRFGVSELEDIEDAIAWLCENRWADASRVGMYGWSYGGFMTAFALTRSDAFKVGIAGAGVYDWRNYDTIYTERYMSTPQDNEEGYKVSSVIDKAADLSGHLLLIHGTMDDNVHLSNTIQFAHELQKADKSFDLMLYPKSRHGVRDADQRWHMRQLMWRTIRDHL